MAIPLFGLPHKINVGRATEIDDGAGGIKLDTALTAIYTNIRGRVTIMSDEDEVKIFGNASGQRWRLIIPYSPNVLRSDFVYLNSASRPAPIPQGSYYRVTWVKPQHDQNGTLHHTSIAMELEDHAPFT